MFSTLQEVEKFFKKRKELGMKPGLERIHELLKLLGNPEQRMKAIHIAGTNGKGSTLNFIHAALRANQYDVGVFTSPSFHGLRGHILLNETPISKEEFISLLRKAYPFIKKMDDKGMVPTEFEILTALAFSYFATHGEIILVETGMGGRFDTTNSFHPILSIITTISLDHIDFLGDSVEKIASHKAGIIKEKTPVILGKMKTEAWNVLQQTAQDVSAPLSTLGKDFSILDQGEYFWWKNGKNEYLVNLKMKGKHQRRNASLSLKALEVLEETGFIIDWDEGVRAMERLVIPGRFEMIHRHPIVIVDAAHNRDGIEAFIDTVNQIYPEEEKHVIVAMFKDKEVDTILQLLSESFTEITLTSFNHPRAWNPSIPKGISQNKIKEVEPDYQVLLNRPLQQGKIYLFTGSLHFITMIREFFRKNL